jgi:hypothetical protein
MDVHYRPMEPNDIRRCVEHVAAHPILGPRYGKLIENLPSAMGTALGCDYGFSVFEELEGSRSRFLGAGLAVFVRDDFLREAKATSFFWVGPELVKRITRGKSPLLSPAEVRYANSTEGLDLMVWDNTIYPQDLIRAEVGMQAMAAFEEAYRGFRLREVFSQANSLEQLYGARDAGGLYFDRLKGCYGNFPELDASNFGEQARNFGITRELASIHGSSRVGALFVYRPPQFGFSRGEQRLLLSALADGGTDEELSGSLGISVYTVKQTWRAIYDRVEACIPELLPGNSHAHSQGETRGKQKKQRLLAYLRERPEELRPVSRTLLFSKVGGKSFPSS